MALPSMSGEHVRIMQETVVQGFLCKPLGMKLACTENKKGFWCGVSVLCVSVRVAV